VTNIFQELGRSGECSLLDLQFAKNVAGLVGQASDEALTALALVSQRTREGHVCLDLGAVAGGVVPSASTEPVARFAMLDAWRAALAASGLVGDGRKATPLVMDARARVYLRRYWEHEQSLAELVKRRLGAIDEPLDTAALRASAARLFGAPGAELDRQRVAAELVALRRLVVISGGPGTGKTSTVVRLVALLVEHAARLGREQFDALLLAPTGKAAQRLSEAVKAHKAQLACDDAVRTAIPEQASTIHRALGSVRGSASRFVHGAERPFRADLVVVDEASMIDVALMRRLIEAVRPEARLVLLGDRHQLLSVQAGTVLGDLCGPSEARGYSPELCARVRAVFGDELPEARSAPSPLIADSVIELTQSFRFRPGGGIGALAEAVRRGDARAALERLRDDSSSEVALCSGPDGARELSRHALRAYAAFAREADPARALASFERFRVLCAHRVGPAGVEAHNRAVERALEAEGLLAPSGRFYAHQPILVEENDYQLGLYNGDVGVILPDRARGGAPSAFFRGAGGALRAVGSARLPAHATAFAMSVHKSQGSEFDEIAVVLPDENSPLLSRELLYTAITRARHRAVLYGSEIAVAAAVECRIERASGLGEALWG
jgi:exodeoxyribonuclease V alpha subunit